MERSVMDGGRGIMRRAVMAAAMLLVLAAPVGAAGAVDGWFADMSVSYGNDANSLVLGGYVTSTDGYDTNDAAAWLGGSLQAYFYHPEWGRVDAESFWNDIRDLNLPKEWTLYVKSTSLNQVVDMTWDLSRAPDTVGLYLTDEYADTTVNMREQSSYSYTNFSSEPRLFLVTASGSLEGPGPADASPPDTIITAAPPVLTSSASVEIGYTGTDDATPAEALEFSYMLDGGGWSGWSAGTTAYLDGLSDGGHGFGVKARDGAGNEDPTPATAEFTVDATPPVLTLNEPESAAFRGGAVDVTISGSVSDEVSGVASVVYEISDEDGGYGTAGSVTPGAGGGFSFTVSLEVLRRHRAGRSSDRLYTIRVTASDVAGNETSSEVSLELRPGRQPRRR